MIFPEKVRYTRNSSHIDGGFIGITEVNDTQELTDTLGNLRDSQAKESQVTTLSASYEQYLYDAENLYQYRPNTIRAYRYELQVAAQQPQFQIPLQDLSLATFEQWIARNRPSPSTIGRRVSTYNSFFSWAIRHELCRGNPLAGLMPIRKRRRLPRPISEPRDLLAIDQAIASAPMPYRLIFTILRETAMRIGEVLNLRRSDVRLQVGRESLRVREPKNGAERVVILGPTATPKALRGLRSHLKHIPTGENEVLFRSNRGTRVSYDAANYQWRQLCSSAGLLDDAGRTRFTIHQLRHTRGTELLADGQPIEIVQRVLGHRDIRSTLLYAEVNEDQVRAALEKPK